MISETLERAGALLAVYRDAAATDDQVASQWKAVQLRRLETFRAIVEMIQPDALTEGGADAAWTIGSIDVFILLRRLRGWSAADYRSWLIAALERQLLR